MENDSDDEENTIDPEHITKVDEAVAAFLGGDDQHIDNEASELIKQIRDQALVEQKYLHLDQKRDEDLARRYLALKNDNPVVNTEVKASSSKISAPGAVPKPLRPDELYDEMEDWCCKFL